MFEDIRSTFVKFVKNAKAPSKTHEEDYCYDVVATSMEDLGGGRVSYGLGIGIQFTGTPQDMCSTGYSFRARSSIHKTGLILSNGIGTIDAGYTGEIKAVFYNIIKELPNYKVGDRIGQIHFDSTTAFPFEEVDSFEETERGAGGYGSTGK